MLRKIDPADVPRRRSTALDAEALRDAEPIVDEVRRNGLDAVRAFARRFKEIESDAQPLILERKALVQALDRLDGESRGVLERTAARIRRFAQAQLGCARELSFDLPESEGTAGHRVQPVERAGCYAPGGRYPLPLSMLMTVVTARVAGVESVWAASPRPQVTTLAAAAIAGADGLLCAGGAHAIAALAYGSGDVPPCDVIVGPGNKWVTAAKFLISGVARIDMLAGPSELVVVADASADPAIVAADLLGQAEHDVDAVPILIAVGPDVVDHVNRELETQLASLSSAPVARAALLNNGWAVEIETVREAARIADAMAPEHLQLSIAAADQHAHHFRNFGGLFIGEGSAEVFGDYGAGPNHVLPTGGTARHSAGLSVLHFLRFPTWLKLDGATGNSLAEDAAALGRMEGLEGHARAAEIRSRSAASTRRR